LRSLLGPLEGAGGAGPARGGAVGDGDPAATGFRSGIGAVVAGDPVRGPGDAGFPDPGAPLAAG